MFAADFVNRSPAPGQAHDREGLTQFNLAIRAAFPDLTVTIDDLIAEGDKVVWRWSARGTQRGELMGIPPTGREVTLTGISIDRLAGGQIVERWGEIDNLGLLQQLGAIPAPGPGGG